MEDKKIFKVCYRTIVRYETYRILVEAKNKKEARILAMAERICKDLPYAIKTVREMKAKHE